MVVFKNEYFLADDTSLLLRSTFLPLHRYTDASNAPSAELFFMLFVTKDTLFNQNHIFLYLTTKACRIIRANGDALCLPVHGNDLFLVTMKCATMYKLKVEITGCFKPLKGLKFVRLYMHICDVYPFSLKFHYQCCFSIKEMHAFIKRIFAFMVSDIKDMEVTADVRIINQM